MDHILTVPVERDTYVIAQSKVGWILRLNGHVLASGMDREAAERAAAVAARLSEGKGRTVTIIAEHHGGGTP
jgi:hypothetical protein